MESPVCRRCAVHDAAVRPTTLLGDYYTALCPECTNAWHHEFAGPAGKLKPMLAELLAQVDRRVVLVSQTNSDGKDRLPELTQARQRMDEIEAILYAAAEGFVVHGAAQAAPLPAEQRAA